MVTYSFISLFHIDSLAMIMIAMVGFIGLIVGIFSTRYMQGDRRYYQFLGLLILLISSVMLMVASDHLVLLLTTWGISNVLLIKLMIHKKGWQAATASGWLTVKTLGIGFICLALAFILLYQCTGQTSVQRILHHLEMSNHLAIIALMLIVVTAISQSAIWPFHRWLISSLNSPTPVSAIMHAGLVNGGGFLLVRFAPLFDSQPTILTIIFLLGLGTATVGTLWKLMQNDIKRMLACSTMAQMGFMLAQCGLGLFPAAVAHLCWHGLFKANLFLSSNNVASEKRFTKNYSPIIVSFMLSLLCGIISSYVFALSSHKAWLANDTTLVLQGVAFIAASQIAIVILENSPWKKLPTAVFVTSFMSGLYGLSVFLIEFSLSSIHMMRPQPLNAFHVIGLLLLTLVWLFMSFKDRFIHQHKWHKLWLMLYVKALNASQPHPSTITSHRNQYTFK